MTNLQNTADYLNSKKVPFAIAKSFQKLISNVNIAVILTEVERIIKPTGLHVENL